MNKKTKILQKTPKPDLLEERLIAGEEVVETAIIDAVGIYWKPFAVLVFAIVLALFVFELGILLATVSALMFCYATVKRKILLLVLTNKRVLVRYGILQVDVVDVHFDKIESVELERMLPGYIIGYSNVVMMGTGNRLIVIPYVANGVDIRKAYNEMVLGDKE